MKIFWQSLKILIFFTVITGIVYPLAMTVIGEIFFPYRSGGSLERIKGQVIGSELIAQKFTQPKYFWPRPSAGDFNANPSGSSNLGPTSLDLKKQIFERREALSKNLDIEKSKIPQDLFTTSGSGLDPDISVEGAKFQIARIVKARAWPKSALKVLNGLVDSMTSQPTFSIFGEKRVNVLKLNIALDRLLL